MIIPLVEILNKLRGQHPKEVSKLEEEIKRKYGDPDDISVFIPLKEEAKIGSIFLMQQPAKGVKITYEELKEIDEELETNILPDDPLDLLRR